MKEVYCPVCKNIILDIDPYKVIGNQVYHYWCVKKK